MDVIAKLFGLGITVAVADIVLAQAGRKDIAYFVTIAGVGAGLIIILPEIDNLFKTTSNLFRF